MLFRSWCDAFVLSMFMIYGCNVCVCKLICCIAEENNSLTAIGENKSLTAEDKKSLATVGDIGILHVLKLESSTRILL